MMEKTSRAFVWSLVGMWMATALPLAGGEETSNEEMRMDNQRKSVAMTAGVLVDAVIEEMEERIVDGGRMEELILEAPVEHRTLHESRRILRSWAQREFEGEFDRRVEEIRLKVNVEQGREVLDPAWSSHAKEQRRLGLERARARAMAGFPMVFEAVRRRAVDRQWAEALKAPLERLFPTPAEIEAVHDQRLEEAALRRGLVARLQKQENSSRAWVLLEENSNDLTELLAGRIRAGRDLLGRQYELLDASQVGGAVARTVEQGFRRGLRKLVESATDGKHYGVFPSIEKAVPYRVDELVRKRLAAELDRGRLCQLVTTGRLRGQIRAQVSLHEDPARSRETLLRDLQPAVGKEAASRHLERHRESMDHLPELLPLLQDEELTARLATSLEGCLQRTLPRARQEIASEQVKELLGDSTKRLDETEILWFRNHSAEASAEELYTKLGLISSIAGAEMLREAQDLLEKEVRELFRQGKDALEGQLSLVDRNQQAIERWRTQMKPRDKIIDHVRRQVSHAWRGSRARVYKDLFERTDQHIADLVDNVFRQETPPSPPPSAPPSETRTEEADDGKSERAETREKEKRKKQRRARRGRTDRRPETKERRATAERRSRAEHQRVDGAMSKQLIKKLMALQRQARRVTGTLSAESIDRIMGMLSEVGELLGGGRSSVGGSGVGGSRVAGSDRQGASAGVGRGSGRRGRSAGGGRDPGTGDRGGAEGAGSDREGASGGSSSSGGGTSKRGGGEGSSGAGDGISGGEERSAGAARRRPPRLELEVPGSCREDLREANEKLLLYEKLYGPLLDSENPWN